MDHITRILEAAEQGDRRATEELLPLVYDELRRLAAAKLHREKPGQTLSATALVHEAFLRLVGGNSAPGWHNRIHFFAAAAESMRRILVEQARSKSRLKRGGDGVRCDVDLSDIPAAETPNELLAVNDAVERLAAVDAEAAQFVKLRYFVGMSHSEAADALGVSTRTADRLWAYARAWLRCELTRQ